MIFQHTWQLVIDGKKTQTRRKKEPRTSPGKLIAVQPGWYQKAECRVEVTDVRRERLGNLSTADAMAEGYASRVDFIAVWEQMHGSFDADEEVWVIEFLPPKTA